MTLLRINLLGSTRFDTNINEPQLETSQFFGFRRSEMRHINFNLADQRIEAIVRAFRFSGLRVAIVIALLFTNGCTKILSYTPPPVVTPPAALVLTPGGGSLPSATQGAAYNAALTVSGGVGPYTFRLDPGSATLPTGLSFGSTAGTASISGTPSGNGLTSGIIVDVTDSESPVVTKKFTYSLTVATPCGLGNESVNDSLLKGPYAFALRGFDTGGKVALIGGVLTADGSGNLTAGAVDMNLNSGVQSDLAIAAGSNYTVGSDARGCMAIITQAGTQNYRFSLGVSGNGHMIDFDTMGPFTTGVLRKQNPAALSINGNYAFGVSSPLDTAQGGGKFAAAGELFLSPGTISSGTMDYNHYNAIANTITLDGVSGATSWPASPLATNVCSCSFTGTNGRGSLGFTPSGESTMNAFIYVVSSAEVLMISSDPRTVNNLFAGAALLQSGGPFTNNSLVGKSVIYNSGLSAGNSSVEIGIFNAGQGGTFSYAGYRNSGGTITTPANSSSGSFSVAGNGRVTLTAIGRVNRVPEFYLFSPNNGFSVFSGSNVDSGFMEAQTSILASGTYSLGSIAPQTAGELDSAATASFSSGNVTGTSDDNSQSVHSPNVIFSTTYSVDSNGVVFIPASCTPGSDCNKIGAIVTPSKIIMMDAQTNSGITTHPNPRMEIADQ